MNIETLNELGITEEKIMAAIVEAALEEIDVGAIVRSSINKQVAKKLDGMAAGAVERVLDNEVLALLSREIVPVDTWGERCGEPTTIRAELHQRAMNYWDTKVNENGEPTTSAYNKKTRAEFLLQKIGHESFSRGIRENASGIVSKLHESLEKSAKLDVEVALKECFKAEAWRR